MTNLQKLKKAIIKQIPERTEHEGVICYECKKKLKLNGYGLYAVTIIRLADVLRVFYKKDIRYSVTYNGGFIKYRFEDGWEVKEYAEGWNLSKNNLDLQSKETIDFLTNLICKDE